MGCIEKLTLDKLDVSTILRYPQLMPLPSIRKDDIKLEGLELISCANAKENDLLNSYKGVHFFVDDYRFKGIYDNPERTLRKYRQYAFLLSPDFSLYVDMPIEEQFYNVFRNRWVGAYWQSLGLRVIATVSWSTALSYRFCCLGIEKHAIVAISTLGCKRRYKDRFLSGYEEVLRQIEPSAIICFGSSFPEMKGNIIVVDYRQSWEVYRGR